MLELELEEIVARRDYKLENIFGCFKCFNDGKTYWKFVTIYVNDGINQKCLDGHITKPYKQCNKCKTTYPLKTLSCPPCESEIVRIITLEKQIENLNELIDETKSKIRRKEYSEDYGDRVLSTYIDKKDILERELQQIAQCQTETSNREQDTNIQ